MYSFAAATVVNDFRVETINEMEGWRLEGVHFPGSWVPFLRGLFFPLGSLFLFVSCGQLEIVQRRRSPSAKIYTCMVEDCILCLVQPTCKRDMGTANPFFFFLKNLILAESRFPTNFLFSSGSSVMGGRLNNMKLIKMKLMFQSQEQPHH